MPEDRPITKRRPAVDAPSVLPGLGVPPLLTSEGSGWRWFGAERYRHSLRELEQPPLKDHVIAVAMGGPYDATQQLDGETREGRYLRGDVCLIPSGRPARWLYEGEVDLLHVQLFKGSTGLSPHRYVIRERVEKARALLSGTDLPIPEVARLCGFASQSHLAYYTRRLLGSSPKSLR